MPSNSLSTADDTETTPNGVGAEKVTNHVAFAILLSAAIFVLIQTFSLIAPIVLSLLLTLIISLALNPVVARFRAWTGGRSIATVMIVVGLLVVLVIAVMAFIGPMRSSVSDLVDVLPGYWERLQKPLIKLEQQAVLSEEKLQAEVTTEIEESEPTPNQADKPPSENGVTEGSTPVAGSLRQNLGQMFREIVGSIAKAAFNGTQFLVVLVTVFFGVIFTLMDPRPIFAAIFLLVPEVYHSKALIIMKRIGHFAPSWAGSMLMGMVTIGVLVFLFMWPIFGIKDALVLGLIAGVFESVPFLGPVLSTVPALLLAFGQGGMSPFWVLLAFIVIQALENNVILPLIMARGMKLHAVAILFSILVCVISFGPLGVIIAAPMVAMVSIIHEEIFRKRYLPSTTDDDLDRLARITLGEHNRTFARPF